MRWNRKTMVGSGSFAAAAVAVAIGAIGTGTGESQARSGDAVTPETAIQAQVSQLEQNRTDLEAQQDAERAEGAAAFDLPAATDFSPSQSFEAIDSQIDDLEAAQQAGRSSRPALDDPKLLWYEDGYFTSLMALDWQCAWLSTGVERVESGEQEGVAEVVETLRSFTSTRYVDAFPDYDAFLADQVDPLLEGDTSGAYSYLPNCSESTLVN